MREHDKHLQPLYHQQIGWPYFLQGYPSFLLSADASWVSVCCKQPLCALQDYGSTGRLDTNDSLRLASLWHSMHAISQQLSPTLGCAGIDFLQADTFDLHCFQSLTGTFSSAACGSHVNYDLYLRDCLWMDNTLS